jgi:hypothetical protein
MTTPSNGPDDDLKNLFFFLGKKDITEVAQSSNEEIEVEDLKFGLRNYGLGLSPELTNHLEDEVKKKINKQKISFDEFKILWENSIKIKEDFKKGDVKDMSNKMYYLIFEMMDYLKEGKEELRLDENKLKEVLIKLEILHDEEDSSDKKSEIEKNNLITVRKMISLYASNGEYVTLKDFEDLVKDYLNSDQKSK